MRKSSFKWYRYNLNVMCERCQEPIPFQEMNNKPLCDKCGTICEHTWAEAVEFSKILKLKQWETGSTNLGGFMRIEMNYKLEPYVNCFNCNHQLSLVKEEGDEDTKCSNCNQIIKLQQFNPDLFFYYHPNEKKDSGQYIIAVRCASCGAPCDANSSNYEYNCKFCNTLNIIPPSI